MANLKVLRRTRTYNVEFFFSLNLKAVPTNSALWWFGHIIQLNQLVWSRHNIKTVHSFSKWPFRCRCRCRRHYLSSLFPAVYVVICTYFVYVIVAFFTPAKYQAITCIERTFNISRTWGAIDIWPFFTFILFCSVNDLFIAMSWM